VTLAGADAHARIGFAEQTEPYHSRVFVRVPSYEAVFKVSSIEVWLPVAPPRDAARAADAVVRAIEAGHVHSIVDGIAAPAVFAFTAQSGRLAAGEGDALPLTDPAFIQVRANIPPAGSIVLYRDGAQVHRVRSQALIYTSNVEGVYRAEAWTSGENDTPLPWIVSNPIYVGRTPPSPPPVDHPQAPEGPVLIPNGWTGWQVDRDARSAGDVERDEDVVTLRYRLAAGPPSGQFAALSTPVRMPEGARGLSFVARSERPMRMLVQLRSGKGATEDRWLRSVYLEPEPHDVVVTFADMVRAGERRDRMPSLSRFDTLLFVVDTLNSKTGSAGSFSLRDIHSY